MVVKIKLTYSWNDAMCVLIASFWVVTRVENFRLLTEIAFSASEIHVSSLLYLLRGNHWVYICHCPTETARCACACIQTARPLTESLD